MYKNSSLLSKISNISILKKLNFFLPILIIFSGLKIYGYVVGFLIFLPYIFLNKKKIISILKQIKAEEKITLYFFFI